MRKLEMTDVMARQQDMVDNAVYEVCYKVLGIPEGEQEEKFPWNMQILAVVRECITDALSQFGKYVCYPYIEHADGKESFCKTEDCHCECCIRRTEEKTVLTLCPESGKEV